NWSTQLAISPVSLQYPERYPGARAVRAGEVARHGHHIEELAHEVIVTGLGDADAPDLAGGGLVTREGDLAIDVRRLAGMPTHHDVLVLVARTFHEDLELAANQAGVFLVRDLALKRHQAAVAPLGHLAGDFAGEAEAPGRLLVRVAKDADPIELGPGHEI